MRLRARLLCFLISHLFPNSSATVNLHFNRPLRRSGAWGTQNPDPPKDQSVKDFEEIEDTIGQELADRKRPGISDEDRWSHDAEDDEITSEFRDWFQQNELPKLADQLANDQKRKERERQLADQRKEQERQLADQRKERERQLADQDQRKEQERQLADQRKERELQLANQRKELERQLSRMHGTPETSNSIPQIVNNDELNSPPPGNENELNSPPPGNNNELNSQTPGNNNELNSPLPDNSNEPNSLPLDVYNDLNSPSQPSLRDRVTLQGNNNEPYLLPAPAQTTEEEERELQDIVAETLDSGEGTEPKLLPIATEPLDNGKETKPIYIPRDLEPLDSQEETNPDLPPDFIDQMDENLMIGMSKKNNARKLNIGNRKTQTSPNFNDQVDADHKTLISGLSGKNTLKINRSKSNVKVPPVGDDGKSNPTRITSDVANSEQDNAKDAEVEAMALKAFNDLKIQTEMYNDKIAKKWVQESSLEELEKIDKELDESRQQVTAQSALAAHAAAKRK